MNRIELLRQWKSEIDSYTLRLAAAVESPDSDFAPQPGMMSFSRLVYHLAECELELDQDIVRGLSLSHRPSELEFDSDVIINTKRLKEVFDYSDTLIRGLSEEDLEGVIEFPDRCNLILSSYI